VLSVANTDIGEYDSQYTHFVSVLRANRFIPVHDTILTCYRDTEGGGPHEQLLKERQTLARLFDCQCCECTGKCGPKQSGGAQNTPVPVKAARDDCKRKICKPLTVPRRYAMMPRLVQQPPEDVSLAHHTQRAGFTRQVKRKARRAAGPKTAPSVLLTHESYAGTGHDMGTAPTNEGHSSGVVESIGSARGNAGSGRTETDWSDNGTSGGTTYVTPSSPPWRSRRTLTVPGTGGVAALLPTPREQTKQTQLTNTATQPQVRLKIVPPMTLAMRAKQCLRKMINVSEAL